MDKLVNVPKLLPANTNKSNNKLNPKYNVKLIYTRLTVVRVKSATQGCKTASNYIST